MYTSRRRKHEIHPNTSWNQTRAYISASHIAAVLSHGASLQLLAAVSKGTYAQKAEMFLKWELYFCGSIWHSPWYYTDKGERIEIVQEGENEQ